ncbi:hypothetical protein HI914_02658 [Erysiphe necator]|nr:hypothetical protein HI914_02658 [Erysiphe necator]
MKTEMKVRGLGSQRLDASRLVVLDFYLPATNGILAQFSREIHIVDELEARVLMGMDIIHPEGWIIDFEAQLLTLPKCAGVQVKILTLTKDTERKIAIYAREKVLVPPQKGVALFLPKHDMMFEPLRQNNFTTFAHLVSSECKAIMVQNPTNKMSSLRKISNLEILWIHMYK